MNRLLSPAGLRTERMDAQTEANAEREQYGMDGLLACPRTVLSKLANLARGSRSKRVFWQFHPD